MPLAQIANTPQLPELPKGPSLDRVFGPVEITTSAPGPIFQYILITFLLLSFINWLILRNRKKKNIAISPYSVALSELTTANDLAKNDNERFAVLCSQALRNYLEDELDLKFSAQTSEEFLRSLKDNKILKSDYQDELAGVLQAFDRIKFARTEIDLKERNVISGTVRHLIDRANEATKTEGDQK